MAIPAALSADDAKDVHEHDLVMPGFRFHPTEEELIEFYLRRKVEGKRFNVELIASVDLYRFDPWELPALAAIGEKELFFYVPRDRKYRNGDRPNRVTTSGYWKATGADRMIRTENHRSIGLKKTLVFYSGKAPKGIRTSWIMNEYRLPQSETSRYQKTEISLCRVYKRAGVEDHFQQPSMLNPKPSSSRGNNSTTDKRSQASSFHQRPPNFQPFAGNSPTSALEKAQRLRTGSTTNLSFPPFPKSTLYGSANSVPSLNSTTSTEDDSTASLHYLQLNTSSLIPPPCPNLLNSSTPLIDELNRIVGLNQGYASNSSQFLQTPPQPQLVQLGTTPMPLSNISDKLWEWISEVGKDYSTFK